MSNQEPPKPSDPQTLNPKQHNPMVMSVDEISAITGWSPATIMKKARAGQIPFVFLSGKRGIFLRETFFYWLKNQERNIA